MSVGSSTMIPVVLGDSRCGRFAVTGGRGSAGECMSRQNFRCCFTAVGGDGSLQMKRVRRIAVSTRKGKCPSLKPSHSTHGATSVSSF
eukprot:3742353-Rhodomonas_salina.2